METNWQLGRPRRQHRLHLKTLCVTEVPLPPDPYEGNQVLATGKRPADSDVVGD